MKTLTHLVTTALAFLCLDSLAYDGAATKQASIIQVTRPLKMAAADPLPPKDYYLDMGEREGLRVGTIVEVYRQLPVQNGQTGSVLSTVRVLLGELKVISTGLTLSVARLHSERAPAEVPSMDLKSFMIGDEVQMKSDLPTL